MRTAYSILNSLSMLHNCKYSHIFPLKSKNILPVAVPFLYLPSTAHWPIIPLTSKDKFVDYVNYYGLLFSELQHILAHGGLQTSFNINDTIWGIGIPENKLCLHGLCCISSLNVGNLPFAFNFRHLDNIYFFTW